MLQQANSEGYNAQVIIQCFKSLPTEEHKAVTKPKQMSEWLNNVFGVGIDHCACLLTILNHDKFYHLFLEYCLTCYGEQKFSWTLSSKIITSKLDFVSNMLQVILTV